MLSRGEFAYLGLIGSETKRARFIKRLGETGLTQSAIGRLICPIGLGSVTSKQPAAIAISVAADLMQRLDAAELAQKSRQPLRLNESSRS